MSRLRGLFLQLFTVLIFSGGVDAQVDSRIQGIIDSPESDNAQFGISIRSIDGSILHASHGDTKMIPGSTMKLVTTLNALEILESNYRYQTRIGYTGDLLSDGTLAGHLVIIGSGDPSLSSPNYPDFVDADRVFASIVKQVQEAGIACVDGDVLIDDSIFDNQYVHSSWSWDDLTNYYAAGVHGLNWHENLYYLSFGRSTTPDKPTRIELINPYIPGLEITNRVRTGPKNSGDNAYLYGDPNALLRWVEGTIPPGNGSFTIKGAIPAPPSVFAYRVYEALMSAGIGAQGYGVKRNIADSGWQEIGVLTSPLLTDLVRFANIESNNLYCDAFLKTLGAQVGEGSFDGGVQVVKDHLSLLGLDPKGLAQVDGSGLSARNRVTPNLLSALIAIKSERLGIEAVKNWLPKVGSEGTVRSLLRGDVAGQSAWLKSGSINHVLAYGGLFGTSSGDTVAVALMANGHGSNRQMRRQMEQLLRIIYEEY